MVSHCNLCGDASLTSAIPHHCFGPLSAYVDGLIGLLLDDAEPLKIHPIIEFQIYRSKAWSEPIGKIVVVIH